MGNKKIKELSFYRYTNLYSLIYLLSEKKISLLDPNSWPDKNDTHFIDEYKKKNKLETVLALCFTQSDETFHHWHVFSNGTNGVRITFNKDKLLACMNKNQEGLRAEDITYKEINRLKKSPPLINELPFLKRYPFRDEKEFRILYESKSVIQDLCKLDITINLSCIERITLSPEMPSYVVEQMKRLIKSIDGCSKLKIYQSTLTNNKDWKNITKACI